MSSKTRIGITGIVENELTEKEKQEILNVSNYDTLEEYIQDKEELIETIIVRNVFDEADEIVKMDVEVEVEE
jgi:hypothetical protein